MNPIPQPPRIVSLGEILWDIVDDQRHAGGAPLNFCYHAHQASAHATLISCVGDDPEGTDLVNHVAGLGLPIHGIQKKIGQPTGRVLAMRHPNGDMKYEIAKPSAWDFIKCTPEAVQAAQQADVIAFGTLAQRSPVTHGSIQQILSWSKGKRFLDINIRAPYYDEIVIRSSLQQAHILKLNEIELAIIAKLLGLVSSYDRTVRSIMDQFSIETVVLTSGADPARAWHGTQTASASAAPVAVADTIGCGDAFSAHFITRLATGASLQQALDQATRAGALVATRSGGTPDYSLNDLAAIRLRKD